MWTHRHTHGRRLDGYTISSPCEPGELKRADPAQTAPSGAVLSGSSLIAIPAAFCAHITLLYGIFVPILEGLKQKSEN